MIPTAETTKRLILIDHSVLLHKAIFSIKFNPTIPATYTYLSMVLGTLARIGLDDPDIPVVFLMDGRSAWRKEIEETYKGNRKAHRAESGIDWDHWFAEFEKLVDYLDKNTNWIFIGPIKHIEADDLASVAVRHFKDIPEIILVTIDHDWEQMWAMHEGVKIFSLQSKQWKIKPNNYNVYAELAKMIKKEVSDNLVTEVMNEIEYDKRMMCVSLLKLPEWVEETCIEALTDEAKWNKVVDHERLPMPSLQQRFDNLYNDHSKRIDYQGQIDKVAKKEARIKKKKELEKLKEKKLKLKALKKQKEVTK